MGVKVISERTLDNKTIKLNDAKDAIEVNVSKKDGNAVKVNEDGIFVDKSAIADLMITDLAGNPIGKITSV